MEQSKSLAASKMCFLSLQDQNTKILINVKEKTNIVFADKCYTARVIKNNHLQTFCWLMTGIINIFIPTRVIFKCVKKYMLQCPLIWFILGLKFKVLVLIMSGSCRSGVHWLCNKRCLNLNEFLFLLSFPYMTIYIVSSWSQIM